MTLPPAYGGSGGGGGGGIDYSLSEQDTGLKWHDGKIIYQKTILKASMNNGGTTTSVAHGITGLSELIDLFGTLQRSNGDQLKLNFSSGGANIGIQVLVQSVNIDITPGSFWNATGAGGSDALSDAVITLLYTK
jgi:hypothetical protein